jgi:hypothetical protein
MAVYQRKGSVTWWYEFQVRGQRFHGSTGQTDRAAAEAVERAERAKRKAEGGEEDPRPEETAPLSRTEHPGLSALYRFYDRAGRLLCVTSDLKKAAIHRDSAHKASATWIDEFINGGTMKAEAFPTSEEAQRAEAAAIEREQPLHRAIAKGGLDWRGGQMPENVSINLKGRIWWYQFATGGGKREQGSTGETDKARAQAIANAARDRWMATAHGAAA